MEVFNLTLTQMLNMFFLILVGFILTKLKILPSGSDKVMSKLETYVFAPALALGNQMANCTVKNFKENAHLMLFGGVICVIALLLAYPLSNLFVRKAGNGAEKYQKNIYRYALTFGNYGYMGNFLVLGIWGDKIFFKYLMFTFFISILCYAWGIYILVPKSENSPGVLANLKNGLLKPPFLSVLLGMFLGLTGFGNYLPSFVHTALTNAGSCMGPVAMLLAGVVIGQYNFKELFCFKKVYVVSFLRLVVIPLVFVSVLKALNVSTEIVTFTLIAFATPLGLNTIVYPAAFGGDTKTGASMTMISHVLSVITIPLMYLLLVANL